MFLFYILASTNRRLKMQVQAINNLSLTQFGRNGSINTMEPSVEAREREDRNTDHAPVSKKTANALRNAFMAGVMAASVAGGMTLTSCEKEELAYAKANASAWVINNWGWGKPDTIFPMKPIPEIDFALNDSLIAQGLNIGAEINGPRPEAGKNVILVSYSARNDWDNIKYDGQIEVDKNNKEKSTNEKQLSYISRVTNNYDPKNVKYSWRKTLITDVPGKGIKFKCFVADDNSAQVPTKNQWKLAYTEIRSNGARGGKPGVNTIYDGDGNMIWKGEYKKGKLDRTCFVTQLAVDPNTHEVVFDPETGEPQFDNHNFDNLVMNTREVSLQDFQ